MPLPKSYGIAQGWPLASGQSANGALTIEGTPVTSAGAGVPYAFTVTASGGMAPRAFSVAEGILPGGAIDALTGEVTGTATEPVQTADIVIRVTDALGATADLPAFQITVSPLIITETGDPMITETGDFIIQE